MSNKKPNCIQVLREIYFKTGTLFETDFERANDMHKNEVKNSHFDGQCLYARSGTKQISLAENSENYYNQKFGGSNE